MVEQAFGVLVHRWPVLRVVEDMVHIQKLIDYSIDGNDEIVRLDKLGIPRSLVGGGHHFHDAPHN
eukprot:13308536-Ditylum_brightwellii.AAC.1